MKKCFYGMLVCSILLWFGTARADQIIDRIAAVVNGQVITLFEVNQEMKPVMARLKQRGASSISEEEVQEKVLKSMIDDILIHQEVEKFGLTVSEVEIENWMNQFKQKHGLTDKELDQQLLKENMTRDEYEEKIREDILKQRLLSMMVRRKVVVTDEEIEKYYKDNIEDYSKEKTVELALIVTAPGESADELKKKVESGEMTFKEAAALYSIGPAPDAGGDLGSFAWDDLAPKWKEHLTGLEEGEISDPFKQDDNEALLLLKNVDDGSYKPLEQVKDEIFNELHGPKLESEFKDYLQTLRDKAVIEIKI